VFVRLPFHVVDFDLHGWNVSCYSLTAVAKMSEISKMVLRTEPAISVAN